MNSKDRKRQVVRKLLNKEIDEVDENELMEMLIHEPLSIDTDKSEDQKRTFGDRLADNVTKVAGSWTFIIIFVLFLIIWMFSNYFMIISIDPFPFVLLNLILSCIAALQAPIIMMSQNREAKKDSLRSLNDYKTDLKSELILEVLHDQMKEIAANQAKIIKLLEEKNDKKD